MKNLKKQALEIYSEFLRTDRNKKRDIECFNIYNGKKNDKDYEYLTKIGEFSFPAKVRWFPVVTAKINKLVSQEAQRPIKSRVYVSDMRSIEEKEEKKNRLLTEFLLSKIDEFAAELAARKMQIAQQKQKLQEYLQRQPQNEEEQQQMAELMANLPMIEAKLQEIENGITFESFVTDKDKEEIEARAYYKDRDEVEEAFQYALEESIKKYDFLLKKVEAFRYKTVTGKEVLIVDWQPGLPDPIFDVVDVINANWSTESNKRFIQDCRWAGYEFEMNINDVLYHFGKELRADEVSKLVRFSKASVTRNNAVVPVPENGAVFTDEESGYDVSNGNNILVTRIFWKQPRDVYYKEVPNKYTGDYFRHVVDKDYVPRKDKGERVVKKYVEDLYEAYILNKEIIVGARKYPVQLRSVDNPSFIQLPMVGFSFNTPSARPYSLIWITKDVQDLISVLNYQRELMFALSGVKGIVMDEAQKSDMPIEKWFYDFKRGVAWINSMKQGRPASFNQFQQYDNSVTNAVGLISQIIESLENNISELTGVTRQAMGQTQPSDQVGTYRMSTYASNLINYILFYEHDVVMKHALTRYVNLGKLAWNNGKKGVVVANDYSQKYFEIQKGSGWLKEFSIYLTDSTIENDKMEDLRRMAISARNNREITLSQLISLYNVESVTEMEKKVQYYADKMQKIAQDNAMSLEDKKAQVQQEAIKLEKEYDMQMAQLNAQLEQYALKLKAAELELKRETLAVNSRLQQMQYQTKGSVDAAKIDSENVIELGYLKEQERMHKADERLRALQLELDALNSQIQFALEKEGIDKNFAKDLKKMDVEMAKAKSQGMGKQKIKDSKR